MDLKLKLLNRIHENKSNTTHPTNQKIYGTLYESVCLDHDAINAKDAEPSFYKRSSRRNKSPVFHTQVDTPAVQPLDQEDEYVRKHPYPGWFPKKSGLAKNIMTWFDLLLKIDIDKNKNHILRPSTVAIAKKLKAIIQKDELTIADLKGVGLERLKQQYQNDVELEYYRYPVITYTSYLVHEFKKKK
ncbi:hypothetical protein Tco_0832537 [Tanacetum coccineum]